MDRGGTLLARLFRVSREIAIALHNLSSRVQLKIAVLLFAMISSKLKQHAPHCHTFVEIIRVRWGKFAHLTFLFFGLATNIIVSSES